jgi:glycosyltransferase involved in cell wall biosynthesis
MATYNGEKYLMEQVESILPQLGENDELIVSDDGSTDRTLKILENFNDKRIKIFHHDRFENNDKGINNKYYSLTQNFFNAMQNAKGDYIFFSDQDDVWLPGRISSTIPFLEKYHLVICDVWVVDENLNKQFLWSEKFPFNRGFLRNIIKQTAHGCTFAFTKKLKELAVPIPKNIIGHDYFVRVLAEKLNSVYFLNKELILYRRHSNTVTSIGSSKNIIWKKIIHRYNLLTESLKKVKKWKTL